LDDIALTSQWHQETQLEYNDCITKFQGFVTGAIQAARAEKSPSGDENRPENAQTPTSS
jgi:hypothetical protein